MKCRAWMARGISNGTVRCSLVSLPHLGQAEDSAQDAPAAAPPVVAVVLAVARGVALDEALAERLRRGVPVVVRPLRAVALPSLSVAGPRVHAGLIPPVHLVLVCVVVVPVITIRAVR